MYSIKMGDKIIDRNGDKVYIIAEIGQNHQGCIDTAKKMIIEAKIAGCDCVKFQKSNLEAKFTQSALDRKYNGEHSWGETYGQHKRFLEFSDEQYGELQKFCKNVQIDFTASAMDEVSLKFLDSLDVPFIKIGSGDANNFPLLEKAAKLKRPLIISTGMQNVKTIDKIVQIMEEAGKSNLALMHCISAYPTQPADCNLQIIASLKTKYPSYVIGYSGHEIGIDISKAATLCGARIIERHFTLSKQQKGSDHKCSLEPMELKQLVDDILSLQCNGFFKHISFDSQEILNILGDTPQLQAALIHSMEEREILPCEEPCKKKLGKTIVAAVDLKAGMILSASDINIKVSEPNGIHAEQYYDILGSKLLKSVKENEPIMYDYLKF